MTAATGSCQPIPEDGYTIVVKPGKGGKGEQHDVVVRFQGGALVADPPRLEIAAGDMVLWHTPDASTPGFAVIGEGEGVTFSSAALAVEAVYSHAFGTVGRYEWVDANGGRVRGEIDVRNLEVRQPDDCKKWLESIGKGTLIHVVGDKANPPRIEILTGQTVFWAVEKAAGISITDSRLLRKKSV